MKPLPQVSDWFQITEVARQVYLIDEPGHVQFYLVVGKQRAALIDTGMGFCDLRSVLPATCPAEIIVLNTHWHYDHIGGNADFAQIGVPALEQEKIRPDLPNQALQKYLCACQQDGLAFPAGFQAETYSIRGSQPTFILTEGEQIDLGGRVLEVLATPGHTHGSLSFFDSATRSLFGGDLVYQGVLYAHFTDSDLDEYLASLRKLLARRNDFAMLFPAHNLSPLPVSFLDLVLAGLLEIKTGEALFIIDNEWVQPVRRYDFGEFKMLTKIPGTVGVPVF